MEQKLLKITHSGDVEQSEIVTFPSLEDAIDAMFRSAYPGIHIRSFKDFAKECEAREKIERAEDLDILSSEIRDVQRLYLRLARGNSSVLLDKQVSKSICRFFFRRTKSKYITILNNSGEHEKFIINDLDDINLYANELKNALNIRILS